MLKYKRKKGDEREEAKVFRSGIERESIESLVFCFEKKRKRS